MLILFKKGNSPYFHLRKGTVALIILQTPLGKDRDPKKGKIGIPKRKDGDPKKGKIGKLCT